MPKRETALVVNDERRELTRGATDLAATAQQLAHRLEVGVGTKADADAAGLFLRGIRTRVRVIQDHYKALRDSINKALRDNRDMEKQDLAPWLAADKAIQPRLEAWILAERKAADDRNAQNLKEAEERAEAQRKEQADQIRRAAASAPTVKERQALERQAKQVEKSPVMAVVTEIEEPPKVEGISVGSRTVAVVVNFKAFVRAILDDKIPEHAIGINQQWLDQQATARGKDLNFPGVVVREKPITSARGL